MGGVWVVPLAVSSAPEDLPATAASSPSDEDLGVVGPWLVFRHTPKSCSCDLSWLDSSLSSHKTTICRVGRIRSLWESYFAPYENFLRSISDDASLSSGLSLANPCADESIFDGPVGSFGFYLFPLERSFIMPPFSDFEVGVLNYLGCPPSMLSPNCWLHMGGFQAICARLEITTTVESFFNLYVAVGVREGKYFHFQAWPLGKDSWVVPYEAHPRLELFEMSPASVETLNALHGKSYRYDDLVVFGLFLDVLPTFEVLAGRVLHNRDLLCVRRPLVLPLPGETSVLDFRASGKQPTDSPRSSVALHSRGSIPRAATEYSLFNNRYDAAAAATENLVYTHGLHVFAIVDEYENATDSRNAMAVEHAREIMVSSREVRADLDAATARVAFLEAELSELRRVAKISRAGEASQRALVSSLEAEMAISAQSSEVSALKAKVGYLEKRVIELQAEVDEEMDKGQDGANWGWDNFHAQLEYLNPGLEYHASSMCIDWEVVDGVFPPIPPDRGVAGSAGVSDDSADLTTERGGDPSVVIAPSPHGPPTVICSDGVPASPSTDEVVAAAVGAGNLVHEAGCCTLDASPRGIPAIRDLDGPFDGAYLFSASP
ncbi:putative transmembrane protein [Senna tora]|uniref:Putative transmembrane protein n=1 Tax=Senna tora TaxID=362788 RepID=A0A834SR64_9FABA|nr:putative transmembrane protein [Senna tora]